LLENCVAERVHLSLKGVAEHFNLFTEFEEGIELGVGGSRVRKAVSPGANIEDEGSWSWGWDSVRPY
jgi:hypothetical protein